MFPCCSTTTANQLKLTATSAHGLSFSLDRVANIARSTPWSLPVRHRKQYKSSLKANFIFKKAPVYKQHGSYKVPGVRNKPLPKNVQKTTTMYPDT